MKGGWAIKKKKEWEYILEGEGENRRNGNRRESVQQVGLNREAGLGHQAGSLRNYERIV